MGTTKSLAALPSLSCYSTNHWFFGLSSFRYYFHKTFSYLIAIVRQYCYNKAESKSPHHHKILDARREAACSEIKVSQLQFRNRASSQLIYKTRDL